MHTGSIGWIKAAILVALSGSLLVSANPEFDPQDFPKHHVVCPAVKRIPNNEAIKISLSYVNINPKANQTLLMIHGWPGLWSTWARQIEEFKSSYHLIIPDLRGFGESTHPGDVRASNTMGDLAGDLTCILKDAHVSSAICVGHDWGAQLCYESARMRPDIFTAVVGAVVPYIPSAGEFVPVNALTGAFPKLTYQLYFDSKTDAATAELDRDIRRSIRSTLRSVDSPPPADFLTSPDSFLGAWSDVKTIPPVPFLSSKEEDYMVQQYRKQGFKYTFEFYTTEDRNGSWALAQIQGNFSVPQPVLAIYPTGDPVANWSAAAELLHSQTFTPNAEVETLGGAHWVHIENPKKFNKIVRKWLEKLDAQKIDSLEDRAEDEL
ncbi:Alpha/Beta hydrolase protein [Collybia nuda]|uniref:Alpha/Beta hydrolase protein n=1 Tax=Collybia nuda TaxID=64659 RepID=A0A9P6CCL1_9AGAR|nr:Alpha/Beta hydrolase protein [Collybia nuda]